MTRSPHELTHESYCDELIAEAHRFADAVRDADLSTPIPTCPQWRLSDLVVHTGEAHRWAAAVVRDVAQQALGLTEDDIDYPADDSRDHAAWLLAGADELARVARRTGGDTSMWAWGPDRRARFWSRRMLHETAVHRADAELALARPFTLAPEIAADSIDEFLENLPARISGSDPDVADLTGDGETLHLHATDFDGEWLIRLTPEGMAWERGHAKGQTAVRGTVRDLTLLVNRRLPADDRRYEVFGDRQLLAFWLDATRFR